MLQREVHLPKVLQTLLCCTFSFKWIRLPCVPISLNLLIHEGKLENMLLYQCHKLGDSGSGPEPKRVLSRLQSVSQ